MPRSLGRGGKSRDYAGPEPARGEGVREFVSRPSNISDGPRDPRGEFLVYCSSNRVTWTAWIVLSALAADRNLMGAGDIFEDIPPTFVPGADRI